MAGGHTLPSSFVKYIAATAKRRVPSMPNSMCMQMQWGIYLPEETPCKFSTDRCFHEPNEISINLPCLFRGKKPLPAVFQGCRWQIQAVLTQDHEHKRTGAASRLLSFSTAV